MNRNNPLNSINLNAASTGRRRFVKLCGGVILAPLSVLSGCAQGTSSHGKRRMRSEVPAEAIQFDLDEGFAKLNKVRKPRWLPAFRLDPRLQNASQTHADLMANHGLYGHEIGQIAGRRTDFKSRIFAAGFDNSAGENLGVGYGSIDEAIQGWMDSPPHRKNMLKARYTLAGLGYAYNISGKNTQYTHFWVLIMGADDGKSPALI